MVVNVIQPEFPPVESIYSCTVLNDDHAISVDRGCNITVMMPTQIRFIFKNSNAIAYHPFGIVFIGSGEMDPTGAVNFLARTISHDAILISAEEVTHGATYKYDIYFQDDHGTEYAIGDGKPVIHNQ